MSFSLQTHHFEKVPNTGLYRISSITPYVRISDGEVAYYIQGGKVYTESGPEVEDPPAWFYEHAKRLTPATKAEVGWKDPEPSVVAAASKTPPATPQPHVARK